MGFKLAENGKWYLPETCSQCGVSIYPYLTKCESCLTGPSSYYILEIETLVSDEAFDDPLQPGLKSYSVIMVGDNGAYEVDRAYRSVREALEQWPEAIPPRIQ